MCIKQTILLCKWNFEFTRISHLNRHTTTTTTATRFIKSFQFNLIGLQFNEWIIIIYRLTNICWNPIRFYIFANNFINLNFFSYAQFHQTVEFYFCLYNSINCFKGDTENFRLFELMFVLTETKWVHIHYRHTIAWIWPLKQWN